MSGPDLFVVCKNCQAEVSPYITECPYCGHRLRKRAPKLDKGAAPRRERRRPRPSAPSFRIPSAERMRTTKPVVAIALTLIPVLAVIAGKAGAFNPLDIVLLGRYGDEPWRLATTLFYYGSTGYELVALATIFLFAWLLERRHGWWAPLLVFLLGGVVGNLIALTVDSSAVSVGGNGGALALLGAWAVRDVLAARREEEIDSDLLGVAMIALLLVVLPATVEEAHSLAGAGGLAVGTLLGFPLARARER